MDVKERPAGLTAMACVNFAFVAVAYYLFTRTGRPLPPTSAVTYLLLLASGFGFINVHLFWGFWVGNVMAVFALGNVMYFLVSQGFDDIHLHLPSLIYPLVVLYLLNTRYRDCFSPSRTAASSQTTEGEATALQEDVTRPEDQEAPSESVSPEPESASGGFVIEECPSCNARVVGKGDGKCPACQNIFPNS
jgi:hypothetical protein